MDYLSLYNSWLNDPRLSAEGKKELQSIAGDDKEIEYRFGGELKFGTGGMRGIIGFGKNEMNVYTVKRATQGLCRYILSINGQNKGIAVSYDTRRKSREFALAAVGVLLKNGIKVFLYKKARPVPMLSYAVRNNGCAAGIMITASHNPKEYNGYKVYGSDGAQTAPEATQVIVGYMNEITDYLSVEGFNFDVNASDEQFAGYDVTLLSETFEQTYYDRVISLGLSKEAVKKEGGNIKLVYTPVHGTGFEPVTTVLKTIGINAQVVTEQTVPDTEFSTVEVPNPEYKETLTKAIALADKTNADVVFGTDPDCDRLGVALRDKKGEFVALSGNQVGVLLLNYILTRLKEENKLKKDSFVVKSFVSTGLAKCVADDFGVELKETPVGFKFIGEKIKQAEECGKGAFEFGFEESCGYLRGTCVRDKDAVVASMLFAELVCYYTYKKVSVFDVLEGIYKKYGYFIDKTISIGFKGLTAMDEMNKKVDSLRRKNVEQIGEEKVLAVRDYLIGVRYCDGKIEQMEYSNLNCLYYELNNGGFVCVRPSGTEPKLKIYYSVCAKTRELVNQKFIDLSSAFEEIFNA